MTKIRCTNAQARLLASLLIYGPALCPRPYGTVGHRFQFRVKYVCEQNGWIVETKKQEVWDGGSYTIYRYEITEAGRAALRHMWPFMWQYYSHCTVHPQQI